MSLSDAITARSYRAPHVGPMTEKAVVTRYTDGNVELVVFVFDDYGLKGWNCAHMPKMSSHDLYDLGSSLAG